MRLVIFKIGNFILTSATLLLGLFMLWQAGRYVTGPLMGALIALSYGAYDDLGSGYLPLQVLSIALVLMAALGLAGACVLTAYLARLPYLTLYKFRRELRIRALRADLKQLRADMA